MPLISSTIARAATVRLVIEQGTDFTHIVGLQNPDGTVFVLTGYTAKMQIKSAIGSNAVLVELSTVNAKIVINGPAGQISLILGHTETSGYTWRSGVYDLEITSSTGLVTRVMEGEVTLFPEITI